MVISYDKLWKLLIDKKMNKTDLKEQAGLTYKLLDALGILSDIIIYNKELIHKKSRTD